jgi:hypothetical protein
MPEGDKASLYRKWNYSQSRPGRGGEDKNLNVLVGNGTPPFLSVTYLNLDTYTYESVKRLPYPKAMSLCYNPCVFSRVKREGCPRASILDVKGSIMSDLSAVWTPWSRWTYRKVAKHRRDVPKSRLGDIVSITLSDANTKKKWRRRKFNRFPCVGEKWLRSDFYFKRILQFFCMILLL